MSEIKFTPKGTKDLEKLPKDLQRRIIKKLEFFAGQINPLYFKSDKVGFFQNIKSLPN